MKKSYYLDIDMDYFVLPIQKAAVDNIRIFKAEECSTLPVASLWEGLAQTMP